MRLTLVTLKYLNWVHAGNNQDSATSDQWLDALIAEVQAILSDWSAVSHVSSDC
jgi:hypothetical protein